MQWDFSLIRCRAQNGHVLFSGKTKGLEHFSFPRRIPTLYLISILSSKVTYTVALLQVHPASNTHALLAPEWLTAICHVWLSEAQPNRERFSLEPRNPFLPPFSKVRLSIFRLPKTHTHAYMHMPCPDFWTFCINSQERRNPSSQKKCCTLIKKYCALYTGIPLIEFIMNQSESQR